MTASPKSQFKDLLEKKCRELDRARTQERIQRELSQVLAMLRAGPVTTKEISEAMGLNTNLARVRIHEVGGVRDEAGLWRLSERG